jgi:triacylglycerol lipase
MESCVRIPAQRLRNRRAAAVLLGAGLLWLPAGATATMVATIPSIAPVAAGATIRTPAPAGARQVVLLHGLFRSSRSMSVMAYALDEQGYEVCNVSYPSRHHTIEVLASDFVAPAVKACFPEGGPIDFVTHSMGGILVRQMAATGVLPPVGRVVMLGPPNGGSELIDEIGDLWLLGRIIEGINGPAGRELGTLADSLPKRLGPATFEVGIIAGDRSWNWLLSRYLPGRDDGKVSVASAELAGMKDFVVMDVNHTFMMRDRDSIAQTIRFLSTGAFEKSGATAQGALAAAGTPAF